jgi:uroporphyrinogen-III decarboxylase
VEEEVHPDGYISGRLKKLEIPEDAEDRPITHWCADTGRYLKQIIRKGEQLRGVENSFEIDPMAKLPD